MGGIGPNETCSDGRNSSQMTAFPPMHMVWCRTTDNQLSALCDHQTRLWPARPFVAGLCKPYSSGLISQAAIGGSSCALTAKHHLHALICHHLAFFACGSGLFARNRRVTNCSKSSIKVYITGITSRLSNVDVAKPPITTVAIGWRKLESPSIRLKAAGNIPADIATVAMMIGRARLWQASTKASYRLIPERRTLNT